MEDSRYDDKGTNLTRESGWDMTPQASKFLHDLLHGKHDASLDRNGARPGKDIARVYVIKDEREETEAGNEYSDDVEVRVSLDLCVEYEKTIAQQFHGTVSRVLVSADFDVEVVADWQNLSDPCEPNTGLGELCEEDQLRVLIVSAPQEVSASLWFSEEMPRGSVRYEVHARLVDGHAYFYFDYAHDQPEPAEPTPTPTPTPVAVVHDDDDLPF